MVAGFQVVSGRDTNVLPAVAAGTTRENSHQVFTLSSAVLEALYIDAAFLNEAISKGQCSLSY